MLSRAPHDRAPLERVVHGEDRRLGIDVDAHVPAGVFEPLAIRVRQEHHRLFGMVDAVGSQAGLVVDDEGDAIDARDVSRRDDDELGPGNVGRELDALDQAAGRGTADGRAKQHPRQHEVVDVLRAPGHFGAAFASWD